MMRQLENDALSSAGWMYADLLLGLMVIFLATISFLPQNVGTGGSGDASGSAYAYTQNYAQQFAVVYDANNVHELPNDIKVFLQQNRIPKDAFISNLTLVAGSKGSSSDAALKRAISQLSNVKKLIPKLIEKASVQMNSSKGVLSGQYLVVAYFAATVNKQATS